MSGSPHRGRQTEDVSRRVQRLARLAHLLDDQFVIPGTRWRVGLDAILGLVPGLGDAATAAASAYIVGHAWRLRVPRTLLLRMAWNVGIDLIAGSVPVVGDLFDASWKANLRNVALLQDHLDGAD